MKFLVVPTESFSYIKGAKGKKNLEWEDLPLVVRKFIDKSKHPFIVLDESSKIKTNDPCYEHAKSTRTRAIKMLNQVGDRCIMTGTLMSKSPLNLYDQFKFLGKENFPESMYDMASRYTIQEILPMLRGKKVLIREKTYEKIRKRLLDAKAEDTAYYAYVIQKVLDETGISIDGVQHIMKSEKYSPFMHLDELLKRVQDKTMFVKRKDIFDIDFEKFVHNPIKRAVEVSAEAKKIGKRLIDVGFTDNFTLGQAAGMELCIRLQDLCNGFEPIKGEDGDVYYKPLKENPKIDALRDLLEEIGVESGTQAVVWCSRKNMLDACAEMFESEDWSYVRFTGRETAAEKDEAQKKFAEKEAKIFLANQASGGYGLNCLSECAYAVYMCVDGSVEQYHQSQHRILRGQLKEPKFAYAIYGKGSIEERQWRSLELGKELIGADNTREVFDFE